MEFRQVVSVCRSAAAAATRPSLASTRPFPSSVLIQRHQFSTNNKQQSEAAATAAPVQQPPSETPVNRRSPAYRVAQLQASLSQNPSSSLPPRPPIRKNNMLEGSQKSWAAPQARSGGNNSSGGASLFRNTTLTGRAPTSSSSSSSSAGTGDLFNLPTQITSDMERATGAGGSKSDGSAGTTETMSTWSEDEFLPKHYDVSEPELRLRPSTGRTIQIKGNVDLARGFRLLHRAVSQNKIKAHVRLTRFHERPALKRKRLKRERWQERFRHGFRATINRVMELKAQGW
ncbi:mitochondrial 37S ribosomal protein bS21m [Thermothelomyces heterothallicus CBS 202.75]|uniref:mitochondrial 37S ribosomal protein bS21m n=1 Tax=Thermothelomyces heterothallicus CBS 202.75 TaxID=1149848 RepID=UPI0037443FB7